MFSENMKLSGDKIDELVDRFMKIHCLLCKKHSFKQNDRGILTTEKLLSIEFSRCIDEIYMQSLNTKVKTVMFIKINITVLVIFLFFDNM